MADASTAERPRLRTRYDSEIKAKLQQLEQRLAKSPLAAVP